MEEDHRSATRDNDDVPNIDIDHDWADAIRETLDVSANKRPSPSEFTICRVPARIRRGKEMYYEPSFISIGPYHRGKTQLKTMEELKWQYLEDFLKRNSDSSMEVYINKLRTLEERARRCYFEHISLTSKEFVEMMLLDSCFIIELLLKYNKVGSCDDMNNIRESSWLLDQVCEDLILLENQIPFLVVQSLFDLLYNSDYDQTEENPEIARLATDFFSDIIPSPTKSHNGSFIAPDEINHLLDLYYKYILPLKEPTESNRFLFRRELMSESTSSLGDYKSMETTSISKPNIHCATKLEEFGVSFTKRTRKSLGHVAFKDGVLEIPPIIIGDNSKAFLFNMVALEQLIKGEMYNISTYVQFMDFIIDTPKDVEILQQCGIITSYLNNSEETCLLFNQLNDYVFAREHYNHLAPLYQKVSMFCNSEWNKHRAKLMSDYFSSPWALLSLVAAIILLILTFVQTYVTVYPCYDSPSTST